MTAADYAGIAICLVLLIYTGVGAVVRWREVQR